MNIVGVASLSALAIKGGGVVTRQKLWANTHHSGVSGGGALAPCALQSQSELQRGSKCERQLWKSKQQICLVW